MKQYNVVGHGGIRLFVRETGPVDAPAIIFVHGWAQCSLVWKYQLESDLANEYRLIAFDLRGHGQSEVPQGDRAYTDPQVFAADIAAVIERSDTKPALIGWSHGSFLVCDYLRYFGDSKLSAVGLFSWAVRMGDTPEERAYIGRGFEDYFVGAQSNDQRIRIESMRGFVRECLSRPISQEDFEEMLCYNIMVPPAVCSATARHDSCDNTELLTSLQIPLWAGHGTADTVVLPAALGLVQTANPMAQITDFVGGGHSFFLEDPVEFNQGLRDFLSNP